MFSDKRTIDHRLASRQTTKGLRYDEKALKKISLFGLIFGTGMRTAQNTTGMTLTDNNKQNTTMYINRQQHQHLSIKNL